MSIIKLQSKNKFNRGIFYFYTMEECNNFLYVFKDHFCNVKWEKPIELPEDTIIDTYSKQMMDIPPKKRAENNLSWGFSVAGDELTAEQSAYVKELIDRMN